MTEDVLQPKNSKETFYCQIPGKVIINGGYLVLKDSECVGIVPNNKSNVKITRQKTDKPKITIITNYDDNAVFFPENNFENSDRKYSTMNYAQNIIRTFHDVLNKKLEDEVHIRITLNDCLYSEKAKTIDKCIKTGLGSSCIFLIAITYALLGKKATTESIFDVCIHINNVLSPNSSGCDIASCIFGSNVYKKYSISNHLQIKNNVYLLLGSFNKSTNTRSMLDLFNKIETDKLKTINDLIIDEIKNSSFDNAKKLKDLYTKYLQNLRTVSDKIVLEKQYNILIDVCSFNIIGCGVSGSGGEDCVWCLVEQQNFDEVYKLWKAKFYYHNVFMDLNGKTTFELQDD